MIEKIIHIALEASKIIMTYYDDDHDIVEKEDNSPLTKADLASNQYIKEKLYALSSDIPYLSEESKIPSYNIRKAWDKFWIVDPLDGTKGFIKKNGEFSVNIALIRNEEPVMGVIAIPTTQMVYFAENGKGAWKMDKNGSRQRVNASKVTRDDPMRVLNSSFHASPKLEEFLNTITVKDRIHMGSSIKFCLMAEGLADIYPRFGPTMEWDTAAGDCIYRNSGGDEIIQTNLKYNTETLKNPAFIIEYQNASFP